MLNRLESGLFALYLAILVWVPLPFASNRPWGAGLMVLLLSVVMFLWLLLFAAGRVQLSREAWRQMRLPFTLLALVQLWLLLQCIPLPRVVIEALSPQAYAWHIQQGWLTLSLDVAATRFYLLQGCALTAGFFLTTALVNSQSRLRLLLQILVFSGTFQAAYGAFMVLSGVEYGFFVEKYAGQGVATGTFVNRNHLAGYLVMCLSAGIGLLLSQLSVHRPANWKHRLEGWLRMLMSPKIRLRIYLAVMVIALVLTRSRMGNIAFFAALSITGLLYMRASGHFSPRIMAFLGSLILVDTLILGRWFGFDKLVQRIEQTRRDLSIRPDKAQHRCHIRADHPSAFGHSRDHTGLSTQVERDTSQFGSRIRRQNRSSSALPIVVAEVLHGVRQCPRDQLSRERLTDNACRKWQDPVTRRSG